MKIRALHLHAWGGFTDTSLHFAPQGLHLVYGPNEAGKTTALRGLRGFLYGMGARPADAWLHEYGDLRIGAELERPDGDLLRLTRHKRAKNTLIDEATGKPVDQSVLDTLLGNMSEAVFTRGFGISYETLLKGRETVLQPDGELGEALFAGATGVLHLRTMRERLEERMGAIFVSSRGQNQRVPQLVKEIKELRRRIKEVSVDHREWAALREKLGSMGERKQEVDGRLRELDETLRRVRRRIEALPLVGRWKEVRERLAPYADAPVLAPDFTGRRMNAETAAEAARRRAENAAAAVAELTAELGTLPVDDRLAACADQVRRLQGQVAVHDKARKDTAELRVTSGERRETVRRTLARLRPDLTPENVDGLRLSGPAKAAVNRLVGEYKAGEAKWQEAREAERKTGVQSERVQAELDAASTPGNVDTLRERVEAARRAGDPDADLADGRAAAETFEHDAASLLNGLPRWQGTLEELEQADLPLERTLRRFEDKFAACANAAAAAAQRRDEAAGLLEQRQAELETVAGGRALVTEADAAARREQRDRGWRSVRAAWLQGAEPDAEFLASFPGLDLADAYERSVRQADEAADELFKHAGDVTRTAALEAEMQRLRDRFDEASAAIEAAEAERQTLDGEWRALWRGVVDDPLPPREMADWLVRAKEVLERAVRLREQRRVVERTAERRDGLRRDLAEALQEQGEAGSVPEGEALAPVLSLARRVLDRHDAQAAALAQLQRKLRDAATAKQEAVHLAADRKRALQDWRREWAEAVAPLGFDEGADPDHVRDFLSALDEVFTALDAVRAEEQRMAAMERDYATFSAAVAELVERAGDDHADLKDRKPEEAVTELLTRVNRDEASRDRRQTLEAERRKSREAAEQARVEQEEHREELQLLCKAAGVDDPGALPDVEERARIRAGIVAELKEVEAGLLQQAGGATVEVFAAEVDAQDPDSLAADKAALEEELQTLEAERTRLIGDIRVADRELQEMDGSSEANELAERESALVAELQDEGKRYVQLRTASAVLAKAIERYREANESPLLEAAGRHFAAMTGGSFAGVRADFNDKGDPVLTARRPDDTKLQIEQLSDGSRDQLFLSLRLAGLERYVQANGPMPFIVDDVLVHFDDDRSSRALQTFASLAEQTQIIFFTHHEHLLELAAETLTAETLHTQTLG